MRSVLHQRGKLSGAERSEVVPGRVRGRGERVPARLRWRPEAEEEEEGDTDVLRERQAGTSGLVQSIKLHGKGRGKWSSMPKSGAVKHPPEEVKQVKH